MKQFMVNVAPQYFFIDVFDTDHHEETCSVYFQEYEGWFEKAKQVSLENLNMIVKCSTLARIRRVYKNGIIIQDNPEYPLKEYNSEWRW
jgi:hypothetical protein